MRLIQLILKYYRYTKRFIAETLKKFPLFLLPFQNKNIHLQRSPFCVGDDGSPNIFAAGIFYALSFAYINLWFRPPCGALMRPLPAQGGDQRESGTFFVSFPVINQHIVSF